MGDRGNIVMDFGEGKEVWFYAHWSGSDLPTVVRNALARRERWGDGPYLSRMIFCELVKNDVGESTGYGIAPYICDNEHAILYVHHESQSVSLRTGIRGETDHRLILDWTFDEFAALNDDQCRQLGRYSRAGEQPDEE